MTVSNPIYTKAAMSIVFLASIYGAPLRAETPSEKSAYGTVVALSANGEVTRDNDQAIVTFSAEEERADKAEAASQINQKMKHAIAILHQIDPQAILQTVRYSTYAVYPPEVVGSSKKTATAPRPIAWRVSQSIEMKTTHLSDLPKTTASVQNIVELTSIHFELSPEALKVVDDERIQQTWRQLQQRIASVARAMGRQPSEAKIEQINLDGAEIRPAAAPHDMMRFSAKAMNTSSSVEEPSFEAGQTVLSMQATASIRFPDR